MHYRSKAYSLFAAINIVFLTLLAAAMTFPYLNTLAIALNDGQDSMLGGITIYPREPTLDNFATIVKNAAMIKSFFISVSRVLIGTFLALVVQFFCAYAFANRNLTGRTPLLIYFMIPMFFSGGLIPTYLLYSKLGLLNHFLVYVLPGAFAFFNMIIIRTYLYTLPDSLQESARIDGASELTVLFRIIVPLCMPIVATIGLWTAVAHWNDWTTTLQFVTNPDLFVLQYKLMQLIRESDTIAALIRQAIESGETNIEQVPTTPEAIRAAQVIVTTIPIILVYPFLQKYFIKGVLIGSVKE
ncbi:carbohydrate ABC transporter permease [Paenibacillus antri]|uniref:Carbohydrate ABC transporter permease n=1 Tax=Paenibacillus antri TaxID=2582848 RepID=A0A5R9G5U3_9BACL|nr:carbohydrate ABC transporter permease [Paenibacillus antri]TLS48334.1 carbohydrate ABC transporter permease [Paenibacillus antri]